MPTRDSLVALPAEHGYFIGLDSDGCCFDSMELKHKECFIPNIIKFWDCQPVSKYARAAAEFVNLYSQHRGVNRFPALLLTFDLLADWDEVRERDWLPPEVPSLRDWVATEDKLGNPALAAAVAAADDPVLRLTLEWSQQVNADIEAMVHDLPPFPLVREVLARADEQADMVVVSGTPGEALAREWAEHGLDGYVQAICGQEVGRKSQVLEWGAGGKYPADRVLMIGDAPGDLQAARKHNYRFYPINPGAEAQSWRRLHDEALERFFAGTYAGAYEAARIDEFNALLPAAPAWQRV